MKQQELKTGVVYALKTQNRSAPIAMVIVSTTRRFERHMTIPKTLSDGKVLRERFLMDIGREFLCVGINGSPGSVTHDELLAAAADCALPEEGHVYDDQNDMSVSLLKSADRRFWVTLLPAKEFAGEYGPEAERIATIHQAEQERSSSRLNERARIMAMIERLGGLTELETFGCTVSEDNLDVNISVRTFEALVGRIEAMRAANPLSDGAL